MDGTYLTTQEVADRFRTSPESVRYWRHRGTGPQSVKIGRKVLYPAQAVRDWEAQRLAAEQAGSGAA